MPPVRSSWATRRPRTGRCHLYALHSVRAPGCIPGSQGTCSSTYYEQTLQRFSSRSVCYNNEDEGDGDGDGDGHLKKQNTQPGNVLYTHRLETALCPLRNGEASSFQTVTARCLPRWLWSRPGRTLEPLLELGDSHQEGSWGFHTPDLHFLLLFLFPLFVTCCLITNFTSGRLLGSFPRCLFTITRGGNQSTNNSEMALVRPTRGERVLSREHSRYKHP